MANRIVLATALVLFVVLLIPLRAGFTDDGFIHIQYARNIVTLGEYSFNPGVVSFGTTSPLWVLLLAAAGRAVGTGDALITVSRILSWLAGLGAVLMMYRFGRSFELPRFFSGLCAVALAGHAWHVRWTALGMETSSAVLAVIGVGVFSTRAFVDRRHAVAVGFFMAVASLLRPECYLFVPVYCAAAVLSRERNLSNLARTLGMYALLAMPWLLFARLHIGSFLPNTAGAKSGGLVADPIALLAKFKPIIRIMGSGEGVLLIAIVASVLFFRRRARVLSGSARFALMWVIALPVAYVIFDIQVLSRYMLLTSPFVVVLGILALKDLLDRFVPARAEVGAVLVVAAAVAVNVVFYFTVVLPPSRAFAEDLTHKMKSIGVYLNENAREDAVVAAADIGYLAFYSRRHVLDLGGLVDTVTNDLREKYSYEEIVDRGLYLELDEYPRVDYFIDRIESANRFDGVILAGYRFESVRVETIRNLGIRRPGPIYYTLYKLERVDDA